MKFQIQNFINKLRRTKKQHILLQKYDRICIVYVKYMIEYVLYKYRVYNTNNMNIEIRLE